MTRAARLLALLLVGQTLALPSAGASHRRPAGKVGVALRRTTGPQQAATLVRLLALRRRGPLPKSYLDGALGKDSLRFIRHQLRDIERSGHGSAAVSALRAAADDLRRDGVLGGAPGPELSSARRLTGYRFSMARYADHVRVLSGERRVRLPRAGGGSELVRLDDRRMLNRDNKLAETVSYLRRYYEGLGLEVRERPFTYRGRRQVNLEVIIPGRSSRTILAGAHYDTASDCRVKHEQPADAMRAAPGADDNASGTAALMELARALRGRKLRDTVRVVHFVGEEEPAELGSHRYVRIVTRRHEPIAAAVIVDAIGSNRDGKGKMMLHTPLKRGSLQLAGTIAQAARALELDVRPVGRTPDQHNVVSVGDTDTAPFVSHHIAAVWVGEDFTWRRGIHDRFDRIDRIDLAYAGRVVQATVEGVARLAGAE